MSVEHRIRFGFGEDADRETWECECGRAGSVGEFGDVEVAAWKHVDEGERVVYVR